MRLWTVSQHHNLVNQTLRLSLDFLHSHIQKIMVLLHFGYVRVYWREKAVTPSSLDKSYELKLCLVIFVMYIFSLRQFTQLSLNARYSRKLLFKGKQQWNGWHFSYLIHLSIEKLDYTIDLLYSMVLVQIQQTETTTDLNDVQQTCWGSTIYILIWI